MDSIKFAKIFNKCKISKDILENIYKMEFEKWCVTTITVCDMEELKEEYKNIGESDNGNEIIFNQPIFNQIHRNVSSQSISMKYVDEETQPTVDPYLPEYIYKAIYSVSEDDKLERLIDCAVRIILSLDCWEKPEFIRKIYSDQHYVNAIDQIFTEIGKDAFFNNFVENELGNQISRFESEIELELRDPLLSDDQVFEAIQFADFEAFDQDENNFLTVDEFSKTLKKHGINVSKKKLLRVWHDFRICSSRKLDRKSFLHWRELLEIGELTIRHEQQRIIIRKRSLNNADKHETGWNVYTHTQRSGSNNKPNIIYHLVHKERYATKNA
eukprot:255763_1